MSGVLLLGANYYGTLAAVRAFGKRGIAVTVADESPRARAVYSKHATTTVVHPPLSSPDALIEWLLAWGAAHPDTVLYPTNDHLAWLFARHRDALSAVFHMHSPTEDAVFALLDKQRLHEACADPAVGIDVPVTSVVRTGESMPEAMTFPLLLKPRTQVLLASGVKGVLVSNPEELDAGLARFRRLVSFGQVLTECHPDVTDPMLQEYLPAAETAIVSVSGYVATDGRVFVRAARKVLQRPRKLGIGLCFEGIEPDPVLVGKLASLCQRVGYYGTFEAEFIADGGRHLLIDVNPRYYSQMAFDIARGLVLPLLVYHAARGDARALEAELAQASRWVSSGREIYSHKAMFDLVIGLQRLSGRMMASDVQRWRAWYADGRDRATDAVRESGDPGPAIADALAWLWSFARHPRSFVRAFVLNEA